MGVCGNCTEDADWVCSGCGLCLECHDHDTLEEAAAHVLVLHRGLTLEDFVKWVQVSATSGVEGEVMMRLVVDHLARMTHILIDIAIKEEEIGKMTQIEKYNELSARLSGESLTPDESEMNDLLSDISAFLQQGGDKET